MNIMYTKYRPKDQNRKGTLYIKYRSQRLKQKIYHRNKTSTQIQNRMDITLSYSTLTVEKALHGGRDRNIQDNI